jgi:hypothetical protein
MLRLGEPFRKPSACIRLRRNKGSAPVETVSKEVVMNRVVVVATMAVFITGAVLVAHSQDEIRMLAGFDMTVARTAKGVSLTCVAGCAWKTLAFTVGEKPTPVNENGMVDSTGNPENAGSLLLRFGTDKEGVTLSCDRGCAWRTLGWRARPDGTGARVNEYGMAARK